MAEDYHWREPPRFSFLSRQKFCRDKDKHVFVATKHVKYLSRQNFCRDKCFVSTNIILSRQACICCDKYVFVATNTCLSRQNFCRDKNYPPLIEDDKDVSNTPCVRASLQQGSSKSKRNGTRGDGSSSMWHQPHQGCKYTTSVDIQKRAMKSYNLSCRITCTRNESARERRIALSEKGQQ